MPRSQNESLPPLVKNPNLEQLRRRRNKTGCVQHFYAAKCLNFCFSVSKKLAILHFYRSLFCFEYLTCFQGLTRRSIEPIFSVEYFCRPVRPAAGLCRHCSAVLPNIFCSFAVCVSLLILFSEGIKDN